MRFYHMIIERKSAQDISPERRREYISPRQGAAPDGWKCVGVCGYHDTPQKRLTPEERDFYKRMEEE